MQESSKNFGLLLGNTYAWIFYTSHYEYPTTNQETFSEKNLIGSISGKWQFVVK